MSLKIFDVTDYNCSKEEAMAYDRLRPSPETGSGTGSHANAIPLHKRKLLLTTSVIALVLIVLVVCGSAAGMHEGEGGATPIRRKLNQAISSTCSTADGCPDHCVDSLLKFPNSFSANEQDAELVRVSFNTTLRHFSDALYTISSFSNMQMDPRVRSAFDACVELLEGSVDALSRAISAVNPPRNGDNKGVSTQDVMTWLSAALTNHDTCAEGFEGVTGAVKDRVMEELKDLSEAGSKFLSKFVAIGEKDSAGTPTVHNRRLLEWVSDDEISVENEENFPKWLGRKERKLLSAPLSEIQADIIVSKDGNGTVTVNTITEAIKKAPEYSMRTKRIEEDSLNVGKKKINLVFIGDGKEKPVITGGKSVSDNLTTFHTATFAASGAGFIARDITFENWDGPAKHQAVALRVDADHAVVYRCNIIGFQDTLYVHSNRQFYRECDIYGTVDFIFGNAAVVLQNCSILAQKPMPGQKITITSQGRNFLNQNTGISIHACRILPMPDLVAANGSFQTYLGRPWRMYSRVVFLLSYMDHHIDPRGWLEWNVSFAHTLYYGEYNNYGPGAAVDQRVNWPGFRVITSVIEATKFTVAQLICGLLWLPSTGIAFLAAL
ncbi:hypothetical protein V6N13_125556 [Hibiscus sabdariffa]|uniref:Pectinesterase n=1 Tax=Hibiscus sabdariffa TaxID=183260 RepID=A0ABR2U5Y7_9ROSI